MEFLRTDDAAFPNAEKEVSLSSSSSSSSSSFNAEKTDLTSNIETDTEASSSTIGKPESPNGFMTDPEPAYDSSLGDNIYQEEQLHQISQLPQQAQQVQQVDDFGQCLGNGVLSMLLAEPDSINPFNFHITVTCNPPSNPPSNPPTTPNNDTFSLGFNLNDDGENEFTNVTVTEASTGESTEESSEASVEESTEVNNASTEVSSDHSSSSTTTATANPCENKPVRQRKPNPNKRYTVQRRRNKIYYPCQQCDQVCTRKSNLERHIFNVHEQQRPHYCEVCKKNFAQRKDLTRHNESQRHLFKASGAVKPSKRSKTIKKRNQ